MKYVHDKKLKDHSNRWLLLVALISIALYAAVILTLQSAT